MTKLDIYKGIIVACIAIIVSVLCVYAAVNYMPLGGIDPLYDEEDMLGASITTIQGTDTISSSRTTINNNFTALNNSKIETGTTSLPLLVGVGTLTTGTWNADTLIVAYGGTGSTTLAQYQVLIGSSTNGIHAVAGLGTSGQFLTSNGAGQPPTWQTSAVDQAIAYTWTGEHIFNATTTLNATTTIASTSITTLNGRATDTYYQRYTQGQFSSSTPRIGETIVAHGMDVTPRMVEVWVTATSSTNTYSVYSNGSATSVSSESCTYMGFDDTGGAHYSPGQKSNIIYMLDDNSGTTYTLTGDLSTLDSTNIGITFSYTGGTWPQAIYVQWEAWY